MKRTMNWGDEANEAKDELGDYETKNKPGEDGTKDERKKNWGR